MYIETRFPVRYAETDQMGIVHHSVYAIWFECGRTEFIKSYGLPYDELERLGIMLPLINLSVNFKLPVRYGNTVIIRTSLKKATKARLIMYYEVMAEGDDKVRSSGTTEHAITGTNLKPVNLVKFDPVIYERMLPMFKDANDSTGEND